VLGVIRVCGASGIDIAIVGCEFFRSSRVDCGVTVESEDCVSEEVRGSS